MAHFCLFKRGSIKSTCSLTNLTVKWLPTGSDVTRFSGSTSVLHTVKTASRDTVPLMRPLVDSALCVAVPSCKWQYLGLFASPQVQWTQFGLAAQSAQQLAQSAEFVFVMSPWRKPPYTTCKHSLVGDGNGEGDGAGLGAGAGAGEYQGSTLPLLSFKLKVTFTPCAKRRVQMPPSVSL